MDDRLREAAALVPQGSIVADIGTDHAYLPCWLVKSGRCPQALACDVASGPLSRARSVIQGQGLSHRVSLRLGDGLQALAPGEADVLILAGMGGRLICAILERGAAVLARVRRLILQPQRNPELVRQWLMEHEWRIVAESLAQVGAQWYNIIAAQPGSMELDPAELAYGPRLREEGAHRLRRPWLEFRLQGLLTLDRELALRPEDGARQRRQELHSQIQLLHRLIDEV